MDRMHPRPRTPRRIRGRWACLLAIAITALAAAGCSAGQITQTSDQVSAVNGSSLEIGHIQVHNIYLDQDPGDPADRARLAFTVVNTSRSLTDRLVSIESPAAAVNILAPPGALTLAPGTALAAGQPVEQLTEPAAPDEPITVALTVRGGLRPGLPTPFTFVFEVAGTGTVAVPTDLWAPGEDVPPTRQEFTAG